jgi:hypothetical protein
MPDKTINHIMWPTPMQRNVFDDILRERERQDEKFGVQTHTPAFWLVILVEEIGEMATEVLNMKFKGESFYKLYVETIQAMAVCMALIECIGTKDPNKMWD